jgi:hypothetical protein
MISFPGVIWALLWTSFEFSQAAHGEDKSADATRSLAAQLIATRVLRSMSSHDVIRALTIDFDLPNPSEEESSVESSSETTTRTTHESQRLLDHTSGHDVEIGPPPSRSNGHHSSAMSVLEVALVGEALKFIASSIVQNVLQDIWKGNVVLWGDLDVNASNVCKKPSMYAWRRTMWAGYARLRVPRYRFAFQVANFSVLLVLFLATLMQADRDHISVQEIFLDIWFLGFAYAELGEDTPQPMLTMNRTDA